MNLLVFFVVKMSNAGVLMPGFSLGDGNTANNIISSVLGDSWQNMFATGPTGDLSELIVNIFQIYNSVVILATSLIVGYSLWSGVVQTAHEGKALGKRYSSLWTPIRMAMGAALTAPVFGISLVQMIVLGVTSISFSVADDVANELGGFIGKGGSLMISAPATQRNEAHRMAAALMHAETCMGYKNTYETDIDMVTGSVTTVSPGWEDMAWRYAGATKPFGVFGLGDGVCGSLIVNYDDEAPYVPEIKAGIEDMAKSIRPAAEAVVRNESNIDPSYYELAVSRYTTMVDNIVAKAKEGGTEDLQSQAQALQASISERGWINLGMWYYRILSVSATRAQSVQFSFEYTPPAKDSIYNELGGMSEYYNRAGGYVSNSASAMTADGDANPVSQDDLYSELGKTFTAQVMDILNTEGDPFLSMVNLGQSTFSLGAFMFTGGKALEFLPGLSKFIPGGQMLDSLKAGTEVLGGVFSWIGGIMLVIGAWLGWYLPMLPFVTWVAGVMGVFIAIIQSLFASQIWAAAHAMPEGEGLAGSHAKQGYMLLISLALRPILIVMGFVFSYYILWAGCWLSIEGLKVYMTTITSGGLSSFVGIFVGLLVAAILVTMILNRSLGFIFESADDILTWIGGGRQLGSEQQSVQRAMGAFAMVINRGGSIRGLSRELKKGMPKGGPGGAPAGVTK